jgi:hypothetical protein
MSGPFIGRSRELRVLDSARSAARAGDAAVVVVTGEAGIGKTRLCREASARAEEAGFAVAWGTCWPEGGAPPLWPWRTILSSLRVGPVAQLLSRDPGGPSIDPERFARFTAITDHLGDACARSPVLIVIDDVHAADPGALLLARFVARTLARHPLMLLLASRIADARVWADSDATLVPLGPFDAAETETFLRCHGSAVLDRREARALHRLTAGHPLHLQHVTGGSGGMRRPIAGSLRAAIDRAVVGLGPDADRVLRHAAALGTAPAIGEVSAVARVSADAVHRALGEAAHAGLVDIEDAERFSFCHELVRQVLYDRLTIDERTDAHARAADALAATAALSPDRLARHAHHALRAASRSSADARRAVQVCRDAAHRFVANFAYERAAALLEAACALHEAAGPGRADWPGLRDRGLRSAAPAGSPGWALAPLLVEWADAVLRCGRLSEARRLYDRAAMAADVEGDPVALARAALGSGGVWVNEHRDRLEWERVTGLQRRALCGLPDGETVLRHRLRMRLAVEEVYRGGPVGPVLDALAEARRLGDGQALAEALSLAHHALLTPSHTHHRPALAEEQIAVASAAGDGMLALIGLCWRTVDAFHLGDPDAPRLLAGLHARADAHSCQSVLYIAQAIEDMLAIRAGRLDEAEAKAHACVELGTRIGDADALGFLGAHLVTIRWIQGRDGELLDAVEQLATSPTLNPGDFSFHATLACLAARAGDTGKARTTLDRLTASGLDALAQSSTWLAAMLSIAEAAHVLGDADVARQVHDLVLPYAELPVTPSLAVTCLGSTERVLGLCCVTGGDLDGAVKHLERAVAATRLLGNRPVTAITTADLATVLLRRQADGDHDRARVLLGEARDEAESMGLRLRSDEWAGQLAQLTEFTATISHNGRRWILTAGAHRAVVPDRVGMRYLATLLTNPSRPIPALELAGALPGLAAAPAHPVLDRRARTEYRRRVADLTARVSTAEAAGDTGAAARMRAEIEVLVDELRRVTGRGGRTRAFTDAAERARTAVRTAITRAITEIADAEPAVAALLRDTVATGTTCCYTPDRTHPVQWTLASG